MVVYYPSAGVLTGQLLTYAPHAWVFRPICPGVFMFPSMSRTGVSRQLMLTMASSIAAHWHQCSLIGTPWGWSCGHLSVATALCKNLHVNMGDEQAGRPCGAPHAKHILKGCSYSLSLAVLANALSLWNKRLTGAWKSTVCAAWHIVQGLVKLQCPSKPAWLLLLISLEL